MIELIETLTLCTMDIRRSPTQAPLIHRVTEVSDLYKTITFKLYTGDLWVANPNAHLYVMTDGYIKPGDPQQSLQGRGICIGHTSKCTGVSFEHFGAEIFDVGPCRNIAFRPNEFYDFQIDTNKKGVTWQCYGPDYIELAVFFSNTFAFQDTYPSFDTVIGVAGDKRSSTYGLFNVIQETRKYTSTRGA
ncbi:MAG: hypothetical protein JRJ45_00450 [Deltaproteobacteria bacterium]|nr:hypothetical protein [Deltaproteobacteria bacterium]